MYYDFHIHAVLSGADWRGAIARHKEKPQDAAIRSMLETYQRLGFVYLRDGGDRWGVGKRSRELAPEYGITYRTPLSPICFAGHYGGFIGAKVSNLQEYTEQVRRNKADGADFIKIMISGLMDFDRCGVLTEEGLSPALIAEMIHIAHAEGLSIMAHANGDGTVAAAAEAGVDSIEHGAYLGSRALEAMVQAHTVWVPTLSAIGNLRGTGRFDESAVNAILKTAQENVTAFAALGGLLAPGTDAGAFAVPHGSLSEYQLLKECLKDDFFSKLQPGISKLLKQF